MMFETNTNEASEYLSQYFSLKIVLIALAYTAMAVLLWTRLRPVYIPKPWRHIVLFCPALWLDSASDRHEYVYRKQAV
ncbi:hypothetical protein ACLBOM_34685 [Escherichia coli]